MKIELFPIDELKAYDNNPRHIPEEAVKAVANSIREFGFKVPVIIDKDKVIVAGHARILAAHELGLQKIPCIVADDLTPEQIKAFRLADNKTCELSGWDLDRLGIELEELAAIDIDMSQFGFEADEILSDFEEADRPQVKLSERFGFDPFSVIDTRSQKWQDRKQAWIKFGIVSEAGRVDKLLFHSPSGNLGFYDAKTAKEKELGRKLTTAEFTEKYYVESSVGAKSGTSIFDPVLCELIYRWFSREGDIVLDPFAGGSVRGVVASCLKRKYYGIDLRQEQIDANRKQLSICAEPYPEWITGNSLNINDLTENVEADLIISCPPYVDLEVYSDLPEDLSTMRYPEFLAEYRKIIANTCSQLRENRFACFVVGEVRDAKGNYYGFVGDTIRAFTDAGLNFYNDAVLLNIVGTAAVRAGKPFKVSRKLCKVHQNVLIFVKGDAKKATSRLGDCEFGGFTGGNVPEEPESLFEEPHQG